MDYPTQRARSQTRVYQDQSPRDPRDIDYFNAPMERTHRSKSLDYRRDGYPDEEEFHNRERARDSTQGYRRNYDYDRDLRLDFDSPRREYGDPASAQFARSRDLARSQDIYPANQSRWQPPSPNQLRQKWYPTSQGRGEYANRGPGLSPKSQTSGKKLNISTSSRQGPKMFNFGRRKEEQSPRSGIYQPPREDYRGEPRDPRMRYDAPQGTELATIGGGGGGGYSRQHQSAYHHSSSSAAHGGGAVQSYGGGRKPQPIIQQQQPGPPISSGPVGPSGAAGGQFYKGGTMPPRQHYRFQCCCFTFTWPPWVIEPTQPPQQIYRNI